MILDTLSNADRYVSLHPAFSRVIAFLRDPTTRELKLGRSEIDGTRLYAIASSGPGKTTDEARLEAHRLYADVHYLISGKESMGWRSIERCHDVESPYDEEKDFMLFSDDPALWFTAHPGTIAVFFPWDAHAPMVSNGVVHKIVVKLKL